MRSTIHPQLPLTPVPNEHKHVKELQLISKMLDGMPEAIEWVYDDIQGSRRSNTGRMGMSAEQVLRAMIIKQMNGFSYEELAFHLSDSIAYQHFCRIPMGQVLNKSTLQRNIKKVESDTLKKINMAVVRCANEEGVEDGKKVRTDCTVVDSLIHHPTDSSLLWDCVRVLTKSLHKASQFTNSSFSDHTRRAKRRLMKILNARTMAKRVAPYRDLLKITNRVIEYAMEFVKHLQKHEANNIMGSLHVEGILGELEHFIPLAQRVVEQTIRRVVNEEKIPVAEKIVSIFEPHTDIIIKNRRETQFGHKICLTAGASNLILDCTVEKGNPADSTLAEKMIKNQVEIYGRPPEQAAFDGGFASKANLTSIKILGVAEVCFSKRCGLAITDMVKDRALYQK
jgi:IS5 family transposase